MKRLMVICALVLCVCLLPAQAGEGADRLLAVKVVKINPAMMKQYEEVVKESMALYKKHGLDVPGIWVSQTETFEYHFVIPMEDHSGIDHLWKAFGDVQKSVDKETMAALEEKFKGAVVSNDIFSTKYMPKLSYMPEGFEEASKDWPYFELMVWHIQPDHYQDAMKLAAAYKALYEKSGIKEGYAIYMDTMGTGLPALNIMAWAKSREHMMDMEKEHHKVLGDKVKPLHEQFLSMTKEVEMVRGKFRPDLSYMPDEEPAEMEPAD